MYFQKLGVSNGSTSALPTVHVVYIFAKWFESVIALLMDSTNSIWDHLVSFVNFSNLNKYKCYTQRFKFSKFIPRF